MISVQNQPLGAHTDIGAGTKYVTCTGETWLLISLGVINGISGQPTKGSQPDSQDSVCCENLTALFPIGPAKSWLFVKL